MSFLRYRICKKTTFRILISGKKNIENMFYSFGTSKIAQNNFEFVLKSNVKKPNITKNLLNRRCNFLKNFLLNCLEVKSYVCIPHLKKYSYYIKSAAFVGRTRVEILLELFMNSTVICFSQKNYLITAQKWCFMLVRLIIIISKFHYFEKQTTALTIASKV